MSGKLSKRYYLRNKYNANYCWQTSCWNYKTRNILGLPDEVNHSHCHDAGVRPTNSFSIKPLQRIGLTSNLTSYGILRAFFFSKSRKFNFIFFSFCEIYVFYFTELHYTKQKAKDICQYKANSRNSTKHLENFNYPLLFCVLYAESFKQPLLRNHQFSCSHQYGILLRTASFY